MNEPSDKLSIFIPTYKRFKELREALDSVIPQARKFNIPVYVSNNDRDDLINNLVASYNYKELHYRENASNIGIDSNMLLALKYCKTNYCLYLGDDDLLMENALERILPELEGNFCGVLLNGFFVDSNLKRIGLIHPNASEHLITNSNDIFSNYWGKMHFGSLIINLQVAENLQITDFIGTRHAYSALVFLTRAKTMWPLKILTTPLVLLREGVKSYQPEIAKILLIECALWLDKMKPYFGAVADETKKNYFQSNFPFVRVLKYLSYKNLDFKDFSHLPRGLRLKVRFVLVIPYPLRNLICKLLLSFKKSLSKEVRHV